MFKMISGAAILGTAALAASPAFAQFAPSGPRIELQAGLDREKGELNTGPGTTLPYSEDALYYGVAAGYDISLVAVALGVDVEVGTTDEKYDFDYTDNGVDYFGTSESGRDLYLGGRITVPIGPIGALYAKAGYNNVRTTLDVTSDDGTDVISELIDSDKDGYRIGGGGRLNLGGGTYVGAEYRFSEYGSDPIKKHQVVGTLGISF